MYLLTTWTLYQVPQASIDVSVIITLLCILGLRRLLVNTHQTDSL